MPRATNIFSLHRDIVAGYKQFVSSFININDEQLEKVVEEDIQTSRFWKEPLVQFNPSFVILGPASEFYETLKPHPVKCLIFDIWRNIYESCRPQYQGYLYEYLTRPFFALQRKKGIGVEQY